MNNYTKHAICLLFILLCVCTQDNCSFENFKNRTIHNNFETQKGQKLKANENNLKPLRYSICYEATKQELMLKIKLKIVGNSSGITNLKVPHTWAWQNDYQLGIRNLQTINEGVQVIPNDNYTEIKLVHNPSQEIEIHYEVIQYWDKPIDREVYYRPIIKNSYYHFIGYGVFVFPEWDEKVTREISIEWLGIPENWVIANSFGVRNNCHLLNISISQLCHAAYMAGDFRIYDLNVKGYPIYIAQRGNWRFQSDDFIEMVESVAYAVRSFWDDYDFPFFLVTLIPTDNTNSKGGTGLTNSLEIFVSPDHNSASDLKFLLAHELFHTWNGRKIKRKEPEELVYWFSEGFTNYYTRLILLRNSLITLEEFIYDYNQTLINYFSSPVINATNEEIYLYTHSNNQMEKLPYLRGDIIAFRWNNLIKEASDYNLDNVMFDLLHLANDLNMVVSAENLNLLISKYLERGVKHEIEQFIDKGQIIIPGANDLGPCVELTNIEYHKFDIGFEYEKINNYKNWHVTKVNPLGPAYKAGLRPNQIIVGRSIYWNQTDKPVKIKIEHNNGVVEILEYMPYGEKLIIPQYKLNIQMYKENPRGCLDWFYPKK